MTDLKMLMEEKKVTKESRHHYTQFYEKYLEPYKNSAKKILEIGVDTGVSILVWLEYFPNAKIYGMDINYSSLILNSFDSKNRVVLFKGNQGDIKDLNTFIKEHGGDFDVIIDDGGHTMQQQQLTLKTYFKHLKSGGLYVIEDLHTSYLTGWDYGQNNTPVTTLELVNHLEVGLGDTTYSTEFIDEDELNTIKRSINSCKVEKNKCDDPDSLNNSEICFIIKK